MMRLLSLLVSVFLFMSVAMPQANSTPPPPVDIPAKTTITKVADTKTAEEPEFKKALYKPFIERYVLDELKSLRVEMATQKNELIQQIVDREHNSVDRAVTYATDTITYFFYLIAGATSLLVLAGWSSVRDMKERIENLANERITKLIDEYEDRLFTIEKQLKKEAEHTNKNRKEIETQQEIQSLWLRAGQDINVASKISIYDEILKLRPDDFDALTYKADAALDLGEGRWALNLCQQALAIDPENAHAMFQLACAHTQLEQYDDAIQQIKVLLKKHDDYHEDIIEEEALKPLHKLAGFKKLITIPKETKK